MTAHFKIYSESHTCEVLESELAESKVTIFAVVEEDGEGVAVLIQPRTTDDAQVLQGQIVELI